MGSFSLRCSLQVKHLVVIIDRNRLQSIENTESTLTLEPLSEKLKTFNWDVKTIDGHDHNEIQDALKIQSQSKPKLIVANTTKGKGVSFMENKVLWHYRSPSEKDLFKAKGELS